MMKLLLFFFKGHQPILILILIFAINIFLPNNAQAEHGLTVATGRFNIEKYPQIIFQLRVEWEIGLGKAIGSLKEGNLKYVAEITEDGKPVKDINLNFVRKINKQTEILEIQYTSARLQQERRIMVLKIDFNGIHNGRNGNRFMPVKMEPNAYIVIAGVVKKNKKAKKLLKIYKKAGLPMHQNYPKLVNSTWIQGLNPNYYIIVPGIPAKKTVAASLAKFIKTSGGNAYIRPVWIQNPENLRVVILDSIKVNNDLRDKIEINAVELIQDIPKARRSLKKSDYSAMLRGSARPAKNGLVVIPYTLHKRLSMKGKLEIKTKYQDSWDCEILSIPAPLDSTWIIKVKKMKTNCRMVGD